MSAVERDRFSAKEEASRRAGEAYCEVTRLNARASELRRDLAETEVLRGKALATLERAVLSEVEAFGVWITSEQEKEAARTERLRSVLTPRGGAGS